jgi:hypothetical protein
MTRSSSTLFAAPDILQRRTLRLLDGDIAAKFMTSVLNLPRVRNLVSSDHFSVDGTLIEAGASMTGPRCAAVPQGRRQGGQALPHGHLMTENRHNIIVDERLTEANGTASRLLPSMRLMTMLRGSTVGADKNYDTAEFVAGCRERSCVPHVEQNNTNLRSAIDGRQRVIGVTP